jgi:hypothetical protein
MLIASKSSVRCSNPPCLPCRKGGGTKAPFAPLPKGGWGDFFGETASIATPMAWIPHSTLSECGGGLQPTLDPGAPHTRTRERTITRQKGSLFRLVIFRTWAVCGASRSVTEQTDDKEQGLLGSVPPKPRAEARPSRQPGVSGSSQSPARSLPQTLAAEHVKTVCAIACFTKKREGD